MSDGAHTADLRLKCAQDHHNQAQSPLFSRLPPELRNEIFVLALHYFDTKNPYPMNSYYRRPDYEYPEKVDPTLLRTCRRIYAEMGFAVHTKEYVFWCHRAPPGASNSVEQSFGRMNETERCNVRRAHFFTQLFYLEDSFPGDCEKMGQLGLGIRSLKITVRQSDWWWWEKNTPLAMKVGWGRALHHLKDLETLDVELEVIKRDLDQLQVIIDRMLRWTFDLASGRILSAEGQDVSTREWNGPSAYEGGMTYNASLQQWIEPELDWWQFELDAVNIWETDEDIWESEFENGTMWGALEDGGDNQELSEGVGDVQDGDEGQSSADTPSENSENSSTSSDDGNVTEGDDGAPVAPNDGQLPLWLPAPTDLLDEISEAWGGVPSAETAQTGTVSTDVRRSSETESAPPLVYCIKTLRWRARANM